MPFAVLSFSASDTLRLGRFVLSGPQSLKDFLEDAMCQEQQAADSGSDGGEAREDCYISWNGNSCVLSKDYFVDVHELLDKIGDHGWKVDQFSTSLTGAGVQCQTYVFSKQHSGGEDDASSHKEES